MGLDENKGLAGKPSHVFGDGMGSEYSGVLLLHIQDDQIPTSFGIRKKAKCLYIVKSDGLHIYSKIADSTKFAYLPKGTKNETLGCRCKRYWNS